MNERIDGGGYRGGTRTVHNPPPAGAAPGAKPRLQARPIDPISDRHREWGAPALATDIDLILLEYSAGRLAALIDYKLGVDRKLPETEAHACMKIGELGERATLPAFCVKYSTDPWRFRVYPLNTYGEGTMPFGRGEPVSERRFVAFLYSLRNVELPRDVAKGLHDG